MEQITIFVLKQNKTDKYLCLDHRHSMLTESLRFANTYPTEDLAKISCDYINQEYCLGLNVTPVTIREDEI